MFGNLVAMLAHAKGASIAILVTLSAATATVGASTPEVQDAVRELAAAVGFDVTDTHGANALRGCDDQKGQPAGVAQRNAADKLVRAAYEKDHKALGDLRGGQDVDSRLVGEIVRNYDDQLRVTMNKALTDIAALTLGREGQVRKAASASPSASPATTASPKPSCTPKPTATGTTAVVATPTGTPNANASPTEEPKGRVAVANRTTLDEALQKIVDTAVEDMDKLVEEAAVKAADVPVPERGKPSDDPANKPEGQGGKPSPKPTR